MKREKIELVSAVFVIVIALIMMLPVSTVISSMGNENNVEIVYIGVDSENQLQMLKENGMEIVVDYNNGFALLKATEGEIAALEYSGFEIYRMESRTSLDLYPSSFIFDSKNGEPEVSTDLKINSYEPGVKGTYIVQFIGPMKGEWREELIELGASVYDYVPNYGFITKMDDATKMKISQLPIVEWVGIYQPAYKIPEGVMDEASSVRLMVHPFEGEDVYELGWKLSEMGATVMHIAPGVGGTIQITTDTVLLPAIASLSEVEVMYKDSPKRALNEESGKIIGSHSAWYTSWSGLPVTLTGEGEVFGIQDTGFDEGDQTDGHIDFFDSPNGDRIIRFTDRTGYSVPDGRGSGLWAASGGTAHGTHCSGIMASDGYAWEKHMGYSTTDKIWHKSNAGICPEAELSIDGVTALMSGLSPSSSNWDAQYGDGACTLSNSWGGASGDYGSTSTTVDNKMDGTHDMMILFAASNDGPRLNTLSENSQAKNGLCVGASENYRVEWLGADNPYIIAEFSSRGGTFSDGRIKPDLVATGTGVISDFSRGEWDWNVAYGSVPQPNYIMDVDEYDYTTKGQGTDDRPDYQYMGGTSMACPTVAGCYALTREYYREVHGISSAPSHLVKATLINGAVRMEPTIYEYPGYDQGWGRVNVEQSLFPTPPRTNQFEQGDFTTTGNWYPSDINLNVSSDENPLKVTLVWLDVSGKSLSRDLNLRVTSPSGVEYRGCKYTDGWSTEYPASYDNVNNVEQVEVEYPEPGLWNVTVIGHSIPSTADFSLIFSADIGPQNYYKVDLRSDYPPAYSVVPNGGSATLPFRVWNYGNTSDTITLSDNSPAGLTVTYDPSSSLSLDPQEVVNVTATVSAGAIAVGAYEIEMTGTSTGDSTKQDVLTFRVDVLDAVLPPTYKIAGDEVSEDDPSVVTFNNGVDDHIFISYRKITEHGLNVWVAHTTLDSNGVPIEPWDNRPVSNNTDYPSDVRITYMPSGTYADRVFITWSGDYPDAQPDEGSWGQIAYSDPPYTSWTNQTVDINTGLQNYNIKRITFLLCRETSQELIFVWEHLDYASLEDPNPKNVDTHCKISTDGGATWGSAFQITPGGGDYHFFPNGVVDQNDVAWVFFYWRTATGNDRDLCVRLYDDGGWSGKVNIWNTLDNIQFPACTSTTEGAAGNRVYFVVTRDDLGIIYRLWVGYTDGDYTSSSPPNDHGGGSEALSSDFTVEGPFASSVSDANYNRRQILNIVSTDDGYTWVPYGEKDNAYDAPNMWTFYSNDGFNTDTTTKITRDAYANGHQMSDNLTIGGTSRMYEVYHSNKEISLKVNYDIYLTIYKQGWESDPDTIGPITTEAAVNYNNVSAGDNIRLTANHNDVQTGYSTVAAAEYFWDSDPGEGSGYSMDPAGSTFDKPTESSINSSVSTSGLSEGWHTLYVRGKDSGGYWGYNDSVDVYIKPSGEVTFQIELVAGLNLISMPLSVTDLFDAQDLIDLINADGGGAVSVSRWLAATGVWDTFNDGGASPFEIEVWEGYFINCNKASTWNACGKLQESIPVNLVAGLTLIGTSMEMGVDYDAQDLINDINADGGSAQAVSRWLAATGVWDTFNDGGASPFIIDRGAGYFVNNAMASTWTP